jgi:hypothetical protein
MTTNLPLILSSACLTAILSGHLTAAEPRSDDRDHDEHEMEQHGAHEHGAARMTVAVTATGLEIALETPAANIFGFEHTAGSDEEHHIVHEAADKLKAADELFSFDKKAACQPDDVDIESNILAAHDKEKHSDGEHHDHEAEKHENHDKEDDNHDKHDEHSENEKDKHDHEEHNHDDGTHSDVDVTWTFKCKQPEQLTEMRTGIFAAFPQGFEKLNVEWIDATSSGAVALEADDAVKFSQ